MTKMVCISRLWPWRGAATGAGRSRKRGVCSPNAIIGPVLRLGLLPARGAGPAAAAAREPRRWTGCRAARRGCALGAAAACAARRARRPRPSAARHRARLPVGCRLGGAGIGPGRGVRGSAGGCAAPAASALVGRVDAGHLEAPDRLADQPLDRRHRLAFVGGRQREGAPALAGAAGAADAVDIVVGVVRHVEIDHDRHVGDVEAARRHVGRHQEVDLAGLERVERRLPVHLLEVAVDVAGVEARRSAGSG